ncbi:MAG: PIN-like domain-containing protein [Chloroflexota bacterium]
MILFFDRNMGTRIPQALRLLRVPVDVRYHQQYYAQNAQDDDWLADCGAYGWVVIGKDYKFHKLPNELATLRLYEVGAFYLNAANLPTWEMVRIFARAYDRLILAAETTPKPFVYWIHANGLLKQQPIA